MLHLLEKNDLLTSEAVVRLLWAKEVADGFEHQGGYAETGF